MGLFNGGRMVRPDKSKYYSKTLAKSVGRQRAVDRAAQAIVHRLYFFACRRLQPEIEISSERKNNALYQ